MPFRQDPDYARAKIEDIALGFSGHLFASICCRLLGNFGRLICNILGVPNTVSVTSLKPVYWPLWVTDVCLEGQAKTLKKGSPSTTSSLLAFTGVHIPGESRARVNPSARSVG
jgi:hypothetical protein